jgi:hypothetical protein
LEDSHDSKESDPSLHSNVESESSDSNVKVAFLEVVAEAGLELIDVPATFSAAVRLKSSIASPSSAPLGASKSDHRIQIVPPFARLSPVILKDFDVLFALELPFRAPTVPDEMGPSKFNSLTVVQLPVESEVASMLYWNSSRSALPALPRRHCSPTYAIPSPPILFPVLFVKAAPIIGITVPDRKAPKALSDALEAP